MVCLHQNQESVSWKQQWVSMVNQKVTGEPIITSSKSSITFQTRRLGIACSQKETRSTLMMHSYKLLLNSLLFVVRIIIMLVTIFKLADASLLLFLPIWPKKLAITTHTSLNQSLNKHCITLKKWPVNKVAQGMVGASVTISQLAGLRVSTLHQEVSNTMEEVQFRYHGTTTMGLSQRSGVRAHTTRRCTFLNTQKKSPLMVLWHSLQASGSGWHHKVQSQVCTTSSQVSGNQIVPTEKLEWRQVQTA